jgi:hypothetical protein
MSISNLLSLLTPGAVFLNEKGRTVKFLMLTNMDLPAKVQVKHPPQVVYADDQGNFYNRDVDNFLEYYKFYNVDPELEARIENLLVFNEDDTDEVEEPAEGEPLIQLTAKGLAEIDAFDARDQARAERFADKVQQSNVPQATTILAQALSVETDDGLLLPPEKVTATKKKSPLKVEFSTMSSTERTVPLVLDPAQLTASLVAYSQYPDTVQSMIMHRLTFALSEQVTIKALQDLFQPNDPAKAQRHTMDIVDVHTTLTEDRIVWTSYVGVFPEFRIDGLYATVILGTDEFRDAEPVDELAGDITDASDFIAALRAEAPAVELDSDLRDATQRVMDSMSTQVQGTTIHINPDNLVSQNTTAQFNTDSLTQEQRDTVIQMTPSSEQLFDQSGTDVPGAL